MGPEYLLLHLSRSKRSGKSCQAFEILAFIAELSGEQVVPGLRTELSWNDVSLKLLRTETLGVRNKSPMH